MKTNYLPRNRSRNNHKKNIFLLLMLFVLGLLAFTVFDGFIIRVVSPIWSGENALAISIRNTAQFFKSKESLIQENNELKEQLLSYNELVLSAKSIEEKDSMLVRAFGRENLPAGIAAAVIVHPPETAYDVLMTDAGSDSGVIVGDRVSAPNGSIIGTVSEAFGRSSRVRLLTSSGEKTNAILERGDLAVILVGLGGGNFKLTLPRDFDVEPGDRILYPGVGSELIAVVGSVTLKPTDSFKEVIAKSPVNIHNQRFVIISHE